MKKGTISLLAGIEKRLKFIHIMERILDYSLPDNIKGMIPDKGVLDILVLITLLYIMDRTLGNDQSCSLDDVERMLDDVSEILPTEYDIDSRELAKFLVVTALQNNGCIKEYVSYDSIPGKFIKTAVRLIDEGNGEYRLTDDTFDFLFRTKEIESEIDYSVARFKLREHLRRDNYKEALSQSKELISRIRNMKQSMDTFERKCREDTSKIAVDEYEKIIQRIRSLLDDEYKELKDIETDAKKRAEKLSEAYNSKVDNSEIIESRKALSEIIKNIDITISEQRSLINMKDSLSDKYRKILEDSFLINTYDRINFERDIMQRIRLLDNDRMGELAKFLLLPLTTPAFPHMFSIESFYNIRDIDGDENTDIGINLNDAIDISEDEIIRKKNQRNIAITTSLFEFAKGRDSFLISDYISSLTVSTLGGFCEDNALQEYLLVMFKIGEIRVKEWRQSEKFNVDPEGELNFHFFLSKLDEDLLDMDVIRILNNESSYSFEVNIAEKRYRIEITDFKIEVERP